jgi:hypothetical protein
MKTKNFFGVWVLGLNFNAHTKKGSCVAPAFESQSDAQALGWRARGRATCFVSKTQWVSVGSQ